MPRLKFLRTPTEAEGGPKHGFEKGKIYDVGAKSYRRWLDIGCAIKAEEEKEEVDIIPSGGEGPQIIAPKIVSPRVNVSRAVVSTTNAPRPLETVVTPPVLKP